MIISNYFKAVLKTKISVFNHFPKLILYIFNVHFHGLLKLIITTASIVWS